MEHLSRTHGLFEVTRWFPGYPCLWHPSAPGLGGAGSSWGLSGLGVSAGSWGRAGAAVHGELGGLAVCKVNSGEIKCFPSTI